MRQYFNQRITRTPEDTAAPVAPWVRLEQLVPAKTAKYARLQDVYRAWLAAASGQSARKIRAKDCPVEFDGSLVRFFLGFYAWPSSPELAYQMTASIGTVGEAQRVELPREFSAFADNTRIIDLQCWMEDVSVAWDSPCYDRFGEQIAPPAIVNRHTYLEFSRECFGALRISGRAVGDYRVLTVEIDKGLWDEPAAPKPAERDGDLIFVQPLPANTLNSNKISNIESTVTATWQGEGNAAATEQLRLEIPQCVIDILNWCPGNNAFILNWCTNAATTVVYYSGCTGEVIKVCDKDERSYCTQIALDKSPAGWLKGLHP